MINNTKLRIACAAVLLMTLSACTSTTNSSTVSEAQKMAFQQNMKALQGEVSAKIRQAFTVPKDTAGGTTKLAIVVDVKGNVLSVDATGDDVALNQAGAAAVKKASPLPVPADNPYAKSRIAVPLQVALE